MCVEVTSACVSVVQDVYSKADTGTFRILNANFYSSVVLQTYEE